eukprot:5659539-Amphidinium_carterae.1
MYENFEYGSATTNTRASGSTSLKRKSELDEKDAKKMTTVPLGAHTVIITEEQDYFTENTAIKQGSAYSTVDTKGDVSY